MRRLLRIPNRIWRALASRIGGARRALAHRLTTPLRWWHGLEPAERVLYRAVVLLAVGFSLILPALAFIVPGSLFALAFFGFSFRRAG